MKLGRLLTTLSAWRLQDIQLPSQLEADLRRYTSLLHGLDPHLPAAALDMQLLVRQALMAHAYSPLQPGTAASGATRAVGHIAEWFVQNVIHDTGELGVSLAVGRLAL